MEMRSATKPPVSRNRAGDRAAAGRAPLQEVDKGVRTQGNRGFERLAEAHTTLNAGPRVAQLRALAQSLNGSAANRAPLQTRANVTGLPDTLKAGVETLSGIAMDDVRVHYGSPEPAQLQAHAFTRGTDIHVAPGQERHLPHEAWHVVQQAQGRVKPTLQLKAGVAINDDVGLEREADAMGETALRHDLGADIMAAPVPAPGPGAAIQRSVDFNPHQLEPVLIGVSGLAGFGQGNFSGLAEELIAKHGVRATEGQIAQAFGKYLDGETICFKDYADAAAWVKARLVGGGGSEDSDDDDDDDNNNNNNYASAVAVSSNNNNNNNYDEDISPEDFIGAIEMTLGEAATPKLIEFYVRQLAIVMRRLTRGEVGIRYLALDRKQRAEVLQRLVQAMVSLGSAMGDPAAFFATHTVVLHGSYLFGALKDKPGDIDVIISGGQSKVPAEIGIFGKLGREPKEDKFTVGSKAGILDMMVGIPFSETGVLLDLSKMSGPDLRSYAQDDIATYLSAAESEKDDGKRVRKYINIAVAIDYVMRRLGADSGLGPFIAVANKALVGGKSPDVASIRAAVKKAFKALCALKD